uniref:uncharacterized protein LOC122592127 n=1 Tax=Erigeron canadensis TaxID=72917 RepID=UPI001CB89E2E|nr:uncharacterized protein LOC122592127 [Erigeron canadensis]
MLLVVYTLEFQKWGLPHAHICLFFEETNKIRTPEDIDRVISAEIPDEEVDSELHHLVSEFMIHGPCGKDGPSNTCMKDKKCSKHFPKEITESTRIDGKGYPVYRRRKTGVTVEKNGVPLDNRYVVGYNPILIKLYQAHMNIEWCNQLGAIKYLFKYINKGPDRITVGFPKKNGNGDKENQTIHEDEIAGYYDCRYIFACKAAWRLFGFDIHYQTPTVQRLSFHIKDRKPILFDQHEEIADVVTKHTVKQS